MVNTCHATKAAVVWDAHQES